MPIRNILGFALGPIATAIFGLIALPLMAWIFAPEDIGRFNIFSVIISFSLLLSVLGLDQAFVREYHESKNKPELLKNCFVPGYFFLVVISLISLFYSDQLARIFFGVGNRWYWLLTIAAAHVGHVTRFLSLVLRMQERGLAFSMSQVLPKFIQLVLILIVAWMNLEKKFIHLLALSIIAMTLSMLVYGWNARDQWLPSLRERYDYAHLKKLFAFGGPLIFSGLAYWGLIATSTFALRLFSNLSELAVYSVATSFAGAAAIFQSIVSVVWAPTMYKWIANGIDMARIDSIARQALALVCGIAVACGSLSWIADCLLPPHYFQVKYLLLCCILQPLLYTMSEITCIGIGVTRRTMLSFWVTLAAMVANCGLSVALVPHHGAAGAAIANAVAFLVFFVGRTEVSARVWRAFPRRTMYIYLFAFAALSILTALVGPVLSFNFSVIWVALVPIVLLSFRAQWLSMWKLISNREGRNVW
jgi:O-antigen/teichoic acid export membrane protein